MGVAPNPVRMGELCSALGDVMQRPSFVPVPDFALQTLLGEGAKVVLEGQRVLPTRAKSGRVPVQVRQGGAGTGEYHQVVGVFVHVFLSTSGVLLSVDDAPCSRPTAALVTFVVGFSLP